MNGKRFSNLLAQIAITLMGLGTGSANAVDPAEKTVIVLVDLSESTRPYRKQYSRYMNKMVLPAIKAGDHIVLAQIGVTPTLAPILGYAQQLDQNPPASTASNAKLAEFENNKKKKVAETKNADTIQSVGREFEKMLAGSSGQTPILDTLNALQRIYEAKPSNRKLLVIFSDMLESTPKGLDFDGLKIVQAKQAEKWIASAVKANKIPKLDSVRVHVAGASAKEQAKYNEVKLFWQTIFKQSGAILVDYGTEMYGFEGK